MNLEDPNRKSHFIIFLFQILTWKERIEFEVQILKLCILKESGWIPFTIFVSESPVFSTMKRSFKRKRKLEVNLEWLY